MSSIIRDGDTFHGISVESRGVFAHQYGHTYAGQCRDGYACGLGVTTWSNWSKDYAEHGPDGKFDGRYLGCDDDGTTWYGLVERGGKEKEHARVSADGSCTYNDEACARRSALACADRAGRPGRGAPRSPSPPPATRPATRRHAIVRWIGRLGFAPRRRWRRPLPPRCTPAPHAVAGGRAAQPNSRRTVWRDRFPREPS
jgi:hypothetical protein